MTDKKWKAKFKGVKKHTPKGEPTPFPFEQESAHFQWFNPRWILCHGYVHNKPHAWIEYKDVVIDLFVPAPKRTLAKTKVALNTAFKTIKKAGLKESPWQKKFTQHAQNKDGYYRKFKPTEVRKYTLPETCDQLDIHQQYGDWLLERGPSARERFMAPMRGNNE